MSLHYKVQNKTRMRELDLIKRPLSITDDKSATLDFWGTLLFKGKAGCRPTSIQGYEKHNNNNNIQ